MPTNKIITTTNKIITTKNKECKYNNLLSTPFNSKYLYRKNNDVSHHLSFHNKSENLQCLQKS